MKVCEHEYENANCTNCANGLPHSGYECAKTKGTLKEYCHAKAEEIHRLKYNEGYEQGYDQGRAEAIDEFAGSMIESVEEIKAWYEEQFKEIYDVQICIVLEDLNNLINQLKEQIKEVSNE